MTKFFEEGFYGDITDAINYFINPIGEFTIVLEGNTSQKKISEEQARALMLNMIQSGVSV